MMADLTDGSSRLSTAIAAGIGPCTTRVAVAAWQQKLDSGRSAAQGGRSGFKTLWIGVSVEKIEKVPGNVRELLRISKAL